MGCGLMKPRTVDEAEAYRRLLSVHSATGYRRLEIQNRMSVLGGGSVRVIFD
jgi:hypothetical protein